LRFKVSILGSRIQIRVWGLGFRVEGLRLRVRVEGEGWRAEGLGFTVDG